MCRIITDHQDEFGEVTQVWHYSKVQIRSGKKELFQYLSLLWVSCLALPGAARKSALETVCSLHWGYPPGQAEQTELTTLRLLVLF